MQIKLIKLSPEVEIPKYMTEGAAGADICANIESDIVLQPFERKLLPTGIKMIIPNGYEVQLRPRSGLALKHGLTLLNSPGTVDSDYRGEIKVILINLGSEPITVRPNERIAQIVINKIERVAFVECEENSYSERGEGGFGHTGK